MNEQVMIGRIDQQLLVTRLMLGYYHSAKITSYKLRHYMVRYLEIMMTVCSILAIKSGTDENMEKKSRSGKSCGSRIWLCICACAGAFRDRA